MGWTIGDRCGLVLPRLLTAYLQLAVSGTSILLLCQPVLPQIAPTSDKGISLGEEVTREPGVCTMFRL
jgi:hypothetical protein